MKPKEIAQVLELSDRTVQKWIAAGTIPEVKKRRKRQCCFDTFAPYVLRRWQEGERRGVVLFQEIREQGFTGSDRIVYRYLDALKHTQVEGKASQHRLQKFSATTAVWLFMRPPEDLDEIEQEDFAAFCQVHSTLKKVYDLIQDFLLMVSQREGDRLDAWLAQVESSGPPELRSFAAGIKKDKEAVRAGLTWEWSNGMVEGHVTKLKLIKRQGYGRADFLLLRKRVLHAI